MKENPFKKLDNLSDMLLSGKVVFFIGAGFSLDSEGNSANRLIRRLIVRFDAITDVLSKVKRNDLLGGKGKPGNIKRIANELRNGLVSTFSLKNNDRPHKTLLSDEDNIKKLSQLYYQINDWICSAYSVFLDEMKKFEDKTKLCEEINCLENRNLTSSKCDNVPLEIIDIKKYEPLDYYSAGKALFLDTMGFDDSDIMGGSPFKPDITDVLKSYHQLLLKRHHILARLAREGLSNPLITTNYDLLLEGAYRLAGFIPREQAPNNYRTKVMYPYFECIGDAGHFFNYGNAFRSAVITKIHGCVNRYRHTKREQCKNLTQNDSNPNTPGNNSKNKHWEKYLPAMVFTYREIQNWREDAWSRDYIRTLLRTRTIAFSGYSGADPVIHDTFRSVYEEIEKQHRKSLPVLNDDNNEKHRNANKARTLAFFLGPSDKKGFHGMEILRAASKAVGVKTSGITNHVNYLEFCINKDNFPNLDELMLWLYHETIRKIQSQCLENNLQQIYMHLLGHPCPIVELDTIKNEFELLFNKEKELASKWKDNPHDRDSLYRITNWSEYFHTGLLKEYAFAEDQMLVQGVRSKIGDKSSPFWYYPFSEKPGWTAWTVVVEIALRKMLNSWQGCFDNWKENTNLLEAISSDTPTLSVSQGDDFKTPILLEIKLHGTEAMRFLSKFTGVFRKKITWFINQETVPWNKKDFGNTPGVETIWEWAIKKNDGKLSGKDSKNITKKLNQYFGEKYGE